MSERTTAGRFDELVKLYMRGRRFLDEETEKKLLEEGITRHGLTLAEAIGAVRSATGDAAMTVQTELEQATVNLLRTMANRQDRVGQGDFAKVAEFYRNGARGGVSEAEARERVKELMEENDLEPRRAGMLFSRRWWRAIGD